MKNILGAYDELIQEEMKKSVTGTDELSNIIRYHLGWVDENFKPENLPHGKLSRPSICLAACEAVGGDVKSALAEAVSLQLFHDFSLLHDDIEDHDEFRRHRKTVWSLWGIPRAINVGDALYNISVRKSIGGKHAAEIIDTFYKIVDGQERDLRLADTDVTEVAKTDYFKMINNKSAELIAVSARVGALCGGASTEVAEKFNDFGICLGIAYQLYDDVIGIWGCQEKSGKEECKDIIEKKKTIPLLMVLEKTSEDEKGRIVQIFSQEKVTSADAKEVVGLLDKYSIKDEMINQIAEYKKKSLSAIEQTGIDDKNERRFKELVEQLIQESEL